MIKPTVGRILHYYPGANDVVTGPAPCAAIVTGVVHDREIHVRAFGPAAGSWSRPNVMLLQDQDQPKPMTSYCKWMEYQVGQAARTEQAEALVAASDAEKTLTAWVNNHLANALVSAGLSHSDQMRFNDTASVVTLPVEARGYDYEIGVSIGQINSDSTEQAALAKSVALHAAGEICAMSKADGKDLTLDHLKVSAQAVPPAPGQKTSEQA